MVMEKNDLEYTIYPSGKFLIKPSEVNGTLSRERAEKEANGLLECIQTSRNRMEKYGNVGDKGEEL